MSKNRKALKSKYHESDFLLVIGVLVLSCFGLVMIFSASYYYALHKTDSAYTYLKSSAIYLALGMIAFVFFSYFDYHMLKKVAIPVLIAGVILLLMIFTPLGITINNSTRWLNFKFMTVMPGEVIKTCLILFIASFFCDPEKRPVNNIKNLLIIGGIGGACAVLILLQPNLSTAGTVLMLVVAMLFIAGLNLFILFGAFGAGVAAFLAIIVSPKGAYMMKRVKTIFDPFADALGDGYQVVQSLYALGSGGILGVGLGKSTQKALYLPEPMNDFILAIIGEELGYIGVIILLLVYAFIIWRCCTVAICAKDRLGMLLASGVAMHIAIQVILNVAIVTATFFPTGVVLPLVSMGGNAVMLFLAELGIVLNVSRQSDVRLFDFRS